MVSCFGRSCLPRSREDEADAVWTPKLVQDLYRQCLKSNNGELIVYGLFARANAVNNNKRLYPKRVLQREVGKYVREQVKGGYALGELDHPSYSCPTFKYLNLPNVSHQVLSVKWKGNALWGYIQVLDTPSGRLIKFLYENGHKLGVSSRGWASLRDLPGKNYKCIMDNFELIAFDFVTEPSTRGAWLLPYASEYPNALPQQRRVEDMSRFGVGALPMEAIKCLPSLAELEHAVRAYSSSIKRVRKLFPVKRMMGPADWAVPKRKTSDNGDGSDGKQSLASAPRHEPAATDLTDPTIVRAICPAMAAGLQSWPSVPRDPDDTDDTLMYIPKAMVTEVKVALPNGHRLALHYGAYVVHASRFGVPKERGLRDYWRHAYLFKERAVNGTVGDGLLTTLSPEAQTAQLDDRTAITAGPDSGEAPEPSSALTAAMSAPARGVPVQDPFSVPNGLVPLTDAELRDAMAKCRMSDGSRRHGGADRTSRTAKRNNLLDMCLHDGHKRDMPEAVCVAEDGVGPSAAEQRGGAASAAGPRGVSEWDAAWQAPAAVERRDVVSGPTADAPPVGERSQALQPRLLRDEAPPFAAAAALHARGPTCEPPWLRDGPDCWRDGLPPSQPGDDPRASLAGLSCGVRSTRTQSSVAGPSASRLVAGADGICELPPIVVRASSVAASFDGRPSRSSAASLRPCGSGQPLDAFAPASTRADASLAAATTAGTRQQSSHMVSPALVPGAHPALVELPSWSAQRPLQGRGLAGFVTPAGHPAGPSQPAIAATGTMQQRILREPEGRSSFLHLAGLDPQVFGPRA